MAQSPQTNLNVPPSSDQHVADKAGKLTERWRAWFTALAEVATWTVTGALTAASAVFSTSMSAPIAGILGSNPLLHVREQQPSGTAGGAFNNGAWRTRTLNVAPTSQIPGGGLAVAPAGVNQILLPAGTYQAWARAPASQVNQHKAKLVNLTAGADIVVGGNALASTANNGETDSVVCGQFTLAVPSVLELQHQCQTTAAGFGFGQTNTFAGTVEVYAEVMIWQLEVP